MNSHMNNITPQHDKNPLRAQIKSQNPSHLRQTIPHTNSQDDGPRALPQSSFQGMNPDGQNSTLIYAQQFPHGVSQGLRDSSAKETSIPTYQFPSLYVHSLQSTVHALPRDSYSYQQSTHIQRYPPQYRPPSVQPIQNEGHFYFPTQSFSQSGLRAQIPFPSVSIPTSSTRSIVNQSETKSSLVPLSRGKSQFTLKKNNSSNIKAKDNFVLKQTTVPHSNSLPIQKLSTYQAERKTNRSLAQNLSQDIFGAGDEETPPSVTLGSFQLPNVSTSNFSTSRIEGRTTKRNNLLQSNQRKLGNATKKARSTLNDEDSFEEEEYDDDFVPGSEEEFESDMVEELSLDEEEISFKENSDHLSTSQLDEEEFDFENISEESEEENVRDSHVDKRYVTSDEEDIYSNESDEDSHKKNKSRNKSKRSKDDAPLIMEAIENLYHIESVLDHKDTIHEGKLVQEYFIKWLGRAHIHNSWHVEWELQGLKGIKKLLNYKKEVDHFEKWKLTATPEEIEQENVYLELKRDLQSHWTQVERVIGERVPPKLQLLDHDSYNAEAKLEKRIQYLVKWKYLPYSEASWEDADTIHFAQKKIDNYTNRKSTLLYNYHPISKKVRSPDSFQKKLIQPSWIAGGELRDYQMEGINWMHYSWCNNTNIILADEMGLGKTIQTISFLNTLMHDHNVNGPFLVVVPLSTINNWITEFKKWAPDMYVIPYIGNGNSRRIARQFEFFLEGSYPTKAEAQQTAYFEKDSSYYGIKRTFKFNVLLTTYELVIKDADYLGRLSWANLCIDEAHRLKNDKAKLYRKLFEFDCESTLLITGTPLQNTLRELWCLLHFLDKDKFTSFELFEEQFGNLESKEVVDSLHNLLTPHILRRMKHDVEKALPKKIERILRVGLSPLQREYYTWILTRDYKELNSGGHQASLSNIVMQLKKVCNHPFLFPSARERFEAKDQNDNRLNNLIAASGKLWLLDKLLDRLKDTGHRVLIFSQMVMVLNLLGEYLTLKGHQFKRLDGSTPSQQRAQSVNHFNDPLSKDFVFLLTTRAGGLGINLTSADTVVIFDSDWNPQQDLQACARAHRIGQRKVVNIYRLITKDTVEEKILEQAKQKMILDHLVIQKMDTSGRIILSGKSQQNIKFTKSDLTEVLQFGAKELFRDTAERNENPTLDEILERAEVQTDGNDSKNEGSLLGSFSVSNFITPGASSESEDLLALAKVQVKNKGKRKLENWKDIIPIEARNSDTSLHVHSRRSKRKNYNEDNLFKPSELVDQKSRKLCNFTSNDTRIFVDTFKQFPDIEQVERILSISNLQQSLSEAQELTKLLIEKCKAAAINSRPFETTFVNFNGIQIDAEEIFRLVNQISQLKTVAKPYISLMKGEQANPNEVSSWPVKWTLTDDHYLLQGILKHGIGEWEQIRNSYPSLRYKICPAHSNGYKRATHQQIARRLDTLLQDMSQRFSDITETKLESAQTASLMKLRIKKRTKPTLPEETCQSMLSFIGETMDELKNKINTEGFEGDIQEEITIIGDTINQITAGVETYVGVFETLWKYVGKKVGVSPTKLQSLHLENNSSSKKRRRPNYSRESRKRSRS